MHQKMVSGRLKPEFGTSSEERPRTTGGTFGGQSPSMEEETPAEPRNTATPQQHPKAAGGTAQHPRIPVHRPVPVKNAAETVLADAVVDKAKEETSSSTAMSWSEGIKKTLPPPAASASGTHLETTVRTLPNDTSVRPHEVCFESQPFVTRATPPQVQQRPQNEGGPSNPNSSGQGLHEEDPATMSSGQGPLHRPSPPDKGSFTNHRSEQGLHEPDTGFTKLPQHDALDKGFTKLPQPAVVDKAKEETSSSVAMSSEGKTLPSPSGAVVVRLVDQLNDVTRRACPGGGPIEFGSSSGIIGSDIEDMFTCIDCEEMTRDVEWVIGGECRRKHGGFGIRIPKKYIQTTEGPNGILPSDDMAAEETNSSAAMMSSEGKRTLPPPSGAHLETTVRTLPNDADRGFEVGAPSPHGPHPSVRHLCFPGESQPFVTRATPPQGAQLQQRKQNEGGPSNPKSTSGQGLVPQEPPERSNVVARYCFGSVVQGPMSVDETREQHAPINADVGTTSDHLHPPEHSGPQRKGRSDPDPCLADESDGHSLGSVLEHSECTETARTDHAHLPPTRAARPKQLRLAPPSPAVEDPPSLDSSDAPPALEASRDELEPWPSTTVEPKDEDVAPALLKSVSERGNSGMTSLTLGIKSPESVQGRCGHGRGGATWCGAV